jgi:hypothetical protein
MASAASQRWTVTCAQQSPRRRVLLVVVLGTLAFSGAFVLRAPAASSYWNPHPPADCPRSGLGFVRLVVTVPSGYTFYGRAGELVRMRFWVWWVEDRNRGHVNWKGSGIGEYQSTYDFSDPITVYPGGGASVIVGSTGVHPSSFWVEIPHGYWVKPAIERWTPSTGSGWDWISWQVHNLSNVLAGQTINPDGVYPPVHNFTREWCLT